MPGVSEAALKKRLWTALLIAGIALIAFGGVIAFMDDRELREGYERQQREEISARDFIDCMISYSNSAGSDGAVTAPRPGYESDERIEKRSKVVSYIDKGGEEITKVLVTGPTFDLTDYRLYGDDNYHSLTPEYAKGEFRFVLSIPDCGIMRGVFGSCDPAVAEADLEMWMVVLMDGAQEPGVTGISIAGHDSVSEDLSFNRLVDIETYGYTGEGHDIILYTYDGVYFYQIESLFDAPRSEGRRDYGYRADLPAQDIYIFTCGRDIAQNPTQIKNHRYKDIIVHGVLYDVMSWAEYREKTGVE